MYNRPIPLIAAVLLACGNSDEPVALDSEATSLGLSASDAKVRTVAFPTDDPGPPLYARVSPLLNQIFVDDGLVAIPFYRDPSCIPPETDLMAHMHPPGPDGPGAFGCDLLIEGHYIIEADAPLGTFPIRVQATGDAQIWFVELSDFQAATADGDLTMAELTGLSPLRGTATAFHEMLAPRMDSHHVVLSSRGRLDDGRTFQFNVNHRGDVTQSILIRIR
jgi:hypothetical protein